MSSNEPPCYPRSKDAASALLGEIGEHERAIRETEARYGRMIAVSERMIAYLTITRDKEIAGHLEFIEPARGLLARWYKLNLKRHGTGQRIVLPTGELKSELDKSWAVVVTDTASAIVKVRRRGMRFLTVTVALNKRTIAADHRRFRRIPELSFIKHRRFRLVPSNLGATPKPSVDRLSQVIGTITAPHSGEAD